MEDNLTRLNSIWHRLIAVSVALEKDDRFSRLRGMTANEIGVIAALSRQVQPMLKDIGSRLGIPKSSLTGIIDRLEKKDLLRREINPHDRRTFALILTAEGERLMREHEAFEDAVCGLIVDTLDTQEEKDVFFSLLEKITAGLEKHVPPAMDGGK